MLTIHFEDRTYRQRRRQPGVRIWWIWRIEWMKLVLWLDWNWNQEFKCKLLKGASDRIERERSFSFSKGLLLLSIFQSTYLDGMLLRLLPLDVDVDEWLKNSTSAFESKFVTTWWLDGIDGKRARWGWFPSWWSLSSQWDQLYWKLTLRPFQQ